MPTLPTPNKTPGDGAPAADINLIIEAINDLDSFVQTLPVPGPQGPAGPEDREPATSRSEEHTSNSSHSCLSRMPSSA